ncbi:serum paraoxonase/arylesterase 2-like [Plakobranchus ocellatus]|uniref:Serum paraoxonase/arylesterase 2-like n=1 Tax=Plakobranchus ocellatus TaxID=259542 RepID=A0AAV3ZFI5_9GAST|nr:serum paraoxonase/arylesterase 2-like [Plakobranchus ocellatus]
MKGLGRRHVSTRQTKYRVKWFLKLSLARKKYTWYERRCSWCSTRRHISSQVNGAYLGSEDLAVTSDGLAFVSSGSSQSSLPSGFLQYLEDNKILSRIILFNFSDPKAWAISLKLSETETFDPKTIRPHGISLVEDTVKGEHILYVINHGESDVLEKFIFKPKTKSLHHTETTPLPGITISNDLAMISEDGFYITSYLNFKSPFMILLEHLVPLSQGALFFYNGTTLTEVVSGLNLPNGIDVSKDHRFVYVALKMENLVQVYSRRVGGQLVLVQTVRLSAGPDNLQEVDQSLLIGVHPIGYKIMVSLYDPRNKAPSSIVKLPLEDGLINEGKKSELFYYNGDLISGSSVAYLHQDKLLIGSVIDTLVLRHVCPQHNQPVNPNNKLG